jgi:hypothetical protein
MHFDLPVQFVSYNNAREEVFLPVTGLLSFLYPRLNGEYQGDKGLLETYFIPGPTIDCRPGYSGSGDNVEISLGDFLHFTGCYITSVSLTIANSFSLDGWPHNVKAVVSFDVMDVSYVSKDGGFMESGLRNQAVRLGQTLENVLSTGQALLNRADATVEKGGELLGKGLNAVLDTLGRLAN